MLNVVNEEIADEQVEHSYYLNEKCGKGKTEQKLRGFYLEA